MLGRVICCKVNTIAAGWSGWQWRERLTLLEDPVLNTSSFTKATLGECLPLRQPCPAPPPTWVPLGWDVHPGLHTTVKNRVNTHNVSEDSHLIVGAQELFIIFILTIISVLVMSPP